MKISKLSSFYYISRGSLIYIIYFSSIVPCGAKSNNNNIIKKGATSIFRTKVMKDTTNSGGKVQLLYDGECSYKLQKPTDMYAISDTNNYPILVTYLPNKNILITKKAFIYSLVEFKEDYGNVSIDEFITKNIINAKAHNEEVSDGRSITTLKNKLIVVKMYFKENEYFAEAYIDEPKYIIFVTLSTSDKNDFNLLYSRFEDVVKSYEYLGVDVTKTK